MISWTSSPYCTSRQFCGPCRDPRDRIFRRSLVGCFELPHGAPDFTCPHGITWNDATCIPHATWCERFGLPTDESTCNECTTMRAAGGQAAAEYLQHRLDAGRAFGATLCVNRRDSGRVRTVRCCGGQEHTVPVYDCALTGHQADCTTCSHRHQLLTYSPESQPQPSTKAP